MQRLVLKSGRPIVATIISALIIGLATAQSPKNGSKGLVFKGKAPINKDTLKVKLPRAYEAKLGNGLQVVVLEQHKLPTFTMQMILLSGGLSDPQGAGGAARFTASLLREGTKTRSSREIAEQAEAQGSANFAYPTVSLSDSRITASGLAENFDQIVELFADVILNPSFPEAEFNKLRTRSLAQLRQQRSDPRFLAREMFAKVMYGSHPASRESLAIEEIQGMSPEVVKKFHAINYKPNNAIFAIVGDVEPAELVAKLEKVFGSWQGGDVPQATIPKVSQTGPAKIHVVNRASSVQTNLLLGNLTIERKDPDYYALDVMNGIVGGGASGRLFLNLREDKGYTYGAYSGFSAERYVGTFRANAEVRTEVTKGSMDELLYEFKRIRDEKVPQEELERAKRTIIGFFAVQLEYPQELLNYIITQKLYDLPADYWDNYAQRIAAITPEDVQRVARKYIDLDHLQVVAVGDASKIADVLKQYGMVEIYDTEGKPVKSGRSN